MVIAEMWQGWEIPGTLGWRAAAALWVSSPGHQGHPCGGRVAGEGGFAGIVQGTRALAEVSQSPLCSLTTPLGEESLIVSSYLKITPAGAPASVAGDAEKSTDVQWGKNSQNSFLKGGDGDHPCLH